jgi:hypothetical protein
MWLMTPIGFFSIVRKPNDLATNTLTIRSRIRSDLEDLRKRYLPGLSEIEENAGTDYRYRATALRSDVSTAFAKMVQDLNYENFKDEVAHKQGEGRERVYEKVWSVLRSLQR